MDAAIKDVGAIILFVQDLTRSKDFYHDLLGLDVQFEDAESVGFKIEGLAFIVLQVDRARVQLQGEPTAVPRAAATAFLTSFTEDVDARHADLAGRGISFFQQPTDQPWGMRTAYFKDPDGHVWEIAQAIEHPERQSRVPINQICGGVTTPAHPQSVRRTSPSTCDQLSVVGHEKWPTAEAGPPGSRVAARR